MHVGLSFFQALDAKDANDHGSISINLYAVLFGDRLGRLVIRRFDASKKFALFCTLPSISTEIIELAKSMSRAFVSFSSKA